MDFDIPKVYGDTFIYDGLVMFCFRLFFARSSSSSCFIAEQWIVGAGRDGEEQEVKQFVTSIVSDCDPFYLFYLKYTIF